MVTALKALLQRRGSWMLLGLTLLVVLVVRVRLREMPLERDEGEYAYAGQLILHGVPPYQEVYNMKLPGTYAAYAAIMAVFGQSPAGIHFGLMLVNLGSVVLVFLLGRRLLDETTGVVGATSFALMSLSPYVYGLAAHATQFVTFFALAGVLVLLKATTGPNRTGPEQEETEITEAGTPFSLLAPVRNTTLPIFSMLFASGCLFGLAFLMKQHGIFFGLFGMLYLVWVWLGDRRDAAAAERREGRNRGIHGIRGKRNRDSVFSVFRVFRGSPSAPPSTLHPPQCCYGGRVNPPPSAVLLRRTGQPSTLFPQLLCFCIGWALPYVITALILLAAGVFPQFWFWTVSYAAKYVSSISAMYSGDMLRNGLRAVVGPNLGLWILPWAGALVMWWEDRFETKAENRKQTTATTDYGLRTTDHGPRTTDRASSITCPRFFLTAFFFCSFASISVGFYFREHYFITLLPVLALLSGVAVSRALHLLRQDKTIELFLALPVLLLFGIGLGAVFVGNSAFWFDYAPRQEVNYSYGTSVFTEAVEVGDYLRTNALPSAQIAIVGSEPEILFYASRRSATGYIYTYPLMEEHAFASTMQRQMIREIESSKPEYAVYVDDSYSWLPQTRSDRTLLDWWNAWWPTNMDLVLTRRIQGKAELTAQAFPTAAGPEQPPEQRYILVLKRKGGSEPLKR